MDNKRDNKPNFKWLSMQRRQFQIHNDTLETFNWLAIIKNVEDIVVLWVNKCLSVIIRMFFCSRNASLSKKEQS